MSADLDGMNEREAEKYVKKDYIWRKNDYQAMINDGVPFDVVYYIKIVRDSLSTEPVYLYSDTTLESKLLRQMQYIETVRAVQRIVVGVKTKGDVIAVFGRFCAGLEMDVDSSRNKWAELYRANPAVNGKLIAALRIQSEEAFERNITREAQKAQFGISKDEKIPQGYGIRFNDGKHTYSKNNDWKPDTFFVVKGHRILQKNFASHDEALKWVQEYAKQRKGGKQRFIPPQLEDVRRDGPDYRDGRDVSGQDYLDVFGFRGGEHGNWMSQNDRQVSLNYGFDALKDMADALCICDRDISYQGQLSIAFGARGSGNAVAHYEPLRNVINLTKMRGAGSLAHEWWHGLDDFLGSKLNTGGYLSEKPSNHPLMAKLIDIIKYKPESTEQAAIRVEVQDSKTKRNAESWLNYDVLPYITKAGDEISLSEYEQLKTAFLNGESGTVVKLNDLKKRITGRIIPKEARTRLEMFENVLHGIAKQPQPKIGRTYTDYYLASKEMGTVCEKDGGYWESNTELTARAFATYLMDRIPGRSDYLVGHAECAVGLSTDKDGNVKIIKAYPQAEERQAINAVFDELFAELKNQQYLTHEIRTAYPAANDNQVTLEIDETA